jgi:hypothetical protein
MANDGKAISVQKSTVPERIVGALVLAIVTVVFFGFGVQKLPSSTMVQEVTEAVGKPALWVTQAVFPEGQHNGPGVEYWDWVYWSSGILIYTLFWYIIVTMLWSTRRTVYSR